MIGTALERRPIERVRGTQDHWPAEARELATIRGQLESCFEAFGYQRIDVPVLEPAELHLRKSGLDIISKLYAFEDQGGRQLCLRPELTASVVRAFVAQPPARLPVKVYATGPVFRYERPSRGRHRQFTQSGVELIGADGGLADAEVIHLAATALDRLGLRDFRVTIGHVGVLGQMLAQLGLGGRLRAFLLESLEDARRHGMEEVRTRLRELDPELFDGAALDPPILEKAASGSPEAVRAAVGALLHQLGADSLGRRRGEDVVDRMLRKLTGVSSAGAVERALGFAERLGQLRGAPEEVLPAGRALLAEFGLPDDPLAQLGETLALLEELGTGRSHVGVDLGLSRGLQYYTGMVFEIDHAGLGAESQLCGGGRYDDLARALGARQPVPALGFAFGVERVRLALEAAAGGPVAGVAPAVLVVPASPAARGTAGRAAQRLRALGLAAQLDVSGRAVRAALAYADREGIPAVAIVGDPDQSAAADVPGAPVEGTLRLRSMASGREEDLPLDDPVAVRRALDAAFVARRDSTPAGGARVH